MAPAVGRCLACDGCELGGARQHLHRAVAELEQARLSWGVWADGIRKLAEQRLGTGASGGFAVLDDPEYARALRMGGWFDEAIDAGAMALTAAGDGEAGLFPGCPCLAVKGAIGSPHP